ncbi:MAG: hypothetical protein ACM3ZF_09745 [Mycobacterium leprae]
MPNGCELSTRTRIRAFRAQQNLLIVAEGELPTPGYRVDIEQDPRRIFPPQFDLLRCALPGVFPTVVTPFRYAETVPFPADPPTVTVHHAEGSDEVTIEGCGEELSAYDEAVRGSPDRPCPDGADQAVGFSRSLSFDEAFADALSKLPPLDAQGADILARVQVAEIGALFGGIAGFNDLFVRICRTHD